jgi:cell division initiation protein
MAIRPVDIRRKEFKNGFRGYDANQVDDFLDEVADEFERTFAENQRMSEEITTLQERLQQFEELESSIREALVHAQQTARDLRRNAGKEAELIVREAKEQSHRILADSSSRIERVQESYEVLRKAKQDFSNDFRHLLKSYLAVMDNTDVASAKEIESSLRERLDLESVAAAREAAETRRIEGRGDEPDAQETGSMEAVGMQGGGNTERMEGRDDEPDAQETGSMEAVGTQGGGDTERIGFVETPGGDTTGAETGEPEVEEAEVEPSSVESPADQRSASERAATAVPETDITQEVDREEPMPAGEGRTADEFFREGETRGDETEERKIFRASRFLRRRE